MDQVGAMSGPLIAALVLALHHDSTKRSPGWRFPLRHLDFGFHAALPLSRRGFGRAIAARRSGAKNLSRAFWYTPRRRPWSRSALPISR